MELCDLLTPVRTAGTFLANERLCPRDIADLTTAGIPADALDRLRIGFVIFDAFGFEFEHHDKHGQEGVRAVLFLVTDGQGVCRDVVAWDRRGGRIATWLNRAWALGEEMVFAPRLSLQGELPVWRTPLGWLRAGCRGICLVRPDAARHHLDCAGPLLAEDVDHGSELKRLLTHPAPRILIPVAKTKAA